MKIFLESVRNKFDYIIIDNAPVGIVADAIIVGELADINLFVVRSDYTRRNQINLIEQYQYRGIIKNMAIRVGVCRSGAFVLLRLDISIASKFCQLS